MVAGEALLAASDTALGQDGDAVARRTASRLQPRRSGGSAAWWPTRPASRMRWGHGCGRRVARRRVCGLRTASGGGAGVCAAGGGVEGRGAADGGDPFLPIAQNWWFPRAFD